MSDDRLATTLVIFGASGDLTRRKLGPALFALHAAGRLPATTRIVGFARTEWDDDAFRHHIRSGIDEFDGGCDEATWATFASRLSYLTGDLTADADFTRLHELLARVEQGAANRLYYLAVAPRFFGDTITRLGRVGMAGPDDPTTGRRHIVIEKPFGHDGASAAALDALVHSVFAESQVFRIDHYLGKETAQNILYFRFANTIFDPLLNRNYVDSVQISVNESVDVGHRGGYYDGAGVWRDMFQNHLMQLLTLIAMEAPAPYNATQLRNEKVKVLASVQPIALGDTVAAQYDGYDKADGVAAGSRTPTYGALKLFVDNWRWADVPFYLRSGKALATKQSEITIEFKQPPYQLFGAFQTPTPNVLSICIQPDEGVHLSFDAKVPGQARDVDSVQLEFHYRTSFPGIEIQGAYERLLEDAMAGDQSLFARSDEIAAAWRLIDPVIAAWQSSDAPALDHYIPGSTGPAAADALLERDGRVWRMGCAHAD